MEPVGLAGVYLVAMRLRPPQKAPRPSYPARVITKTLAAATMWLGIQGCHPVRGPTLATAAEHRALRDEQIPEQAEAEPPPEAPQTTGAADAPDPPRTEISDATYPPRTEISDATYPPRAEISADLQPPVEWMVWLEDTGFRPMMDPSPSEPPLPVARTARMAGALVRPQWIRPEIRRQATPAIRACYEEGLQRSASLAGRVTIRFVIAPTGAVTYAAPTHSTLGDPAVAHCVASAVSAVSFAPTADHTVVTYPFLFRRGPGPGPGLPFSGAHLRPSPLGRLPPSPGPWQ